MVSTKVEDFTSGTIDNLAAIIEIFIKEEQIEVIALSHAYQGEKFTALLVYKKH